MLQALINCFKIPELRQRIIFTLALVVVVRIGASIPCPGINPLVLGEFFKQVIDSQDQGSVIACSTFSAAAPSKTAPSSH